MIEVVFLQRLWRTEFTKVPRVSVAQQLMAERSGRALVSKV